MTPEEVLERYFQALRDQDWTALRECVSEGVHRTGPYLDVVEGRDAYADFLAGVVPKLPNYELRVRDVKLLASGGAVVRLSEILDVDGVSTEHPEMLLFEFDADGRIDRVDIYLKRERPSRSP
jgi:hypothetical protein